MANCWKCNNQLTPGDSGEMCFNCFEKLALKLDKAFDDIEHGRCQPLSEFLKELKDKTTKG